MRRFLVITYTALLFVLISFPAEASCIRAHSGFSRLIDFLLWAVCLCFIIGYGSKAFSCLVKWQPARYYLRWTLGYIFVLVVYLVLLNQFDISEFKGYHLYSESFASREDYRDYHLYVVVNFDRFVIQSLFYFALAGMIAWGVKYKKTTLSLFMLLWFVYAVPYVYYSYRYFKFEPRSCEIVRAERKNDVMSGGCPESCLAGNDETETSP